MFQPPFTRFAAQDQLVWKILFDRQTALLHRRAAPAFRRGLQQLEMQRDAIPDLSALSATVQAACNWQLVPYGQPVDPATLFGLLAEYKFPIVSRIRPMRDFDFTPVPDLFHDLFGHVPMLLDPALADFLHALGLAAARLPATALAAQRKAWALYFFTAEFGLVRGDDRPQFYGAGLLSSAGEIHHCAHADTARLDFDLATVLRTPVRDTRYQEQYFVLPDWETLGTSVAELEELLSSHAKVNV